MAAPRKHIYEFGPFTLIPSERQLLRANHPVSLAGKSFDLLVALVENSGRLVAKEQLLKSIWPDSFVEEANLSVNMSALRRALGEGPDDHRYVETVPRHGYRFVAEVKERWQNGTDGASDHPIDGGTTNRERPTVPATQQIALPQSSSFRRWAFVAIALALLTGIIILLNVGGLRARLFGTTARINVQSLAVVPLKNASGDTAQEYFVDGITDALVTEFAKIGGLRVISRASSMRYKDTQNSPAEIGRDLKVDAIMTGSASRTADRIRVDLQLIDVSTGQEVWRTEYNRDLGEAVNLQTEVVRDVGQNIGLQIPPAPPANNARPVNSEAYDHYLRGKFYLDRQTKEDNEAAIGSLEKAVAKDPSFAAAHAELAQAYTWKLFLFAPHEKQLEERAFVEVEKALASDPNCSVAYLARGRLLWTPANHFPHDKAIQEYRRALGLNPGLDEARNQLALVYGHVGLLDEALEELAKAVASNPGNSLARFRVGQILLFQGKNEEALTALKSVSKDANPALLGHQVVLALFNLGKKDEASATLDQFLRDHPEDYGGLLSSLQAMIAASAGQKRVAEDKIKSAIEKGKGFGHFHHTAYYIACAYALMNNPDQATKWLEAAADDGFPCYPLFVSDRNLDNIRQDPRFVAFLSKSKQKWEYYRTLRQS